MDAPAKNDENVAEIDQDSLLMLEAVVMTVQKSFAKCINGRGGLRTPSSCHDQSPGVYINQHVKSTSL